MACQAFMDIEKLGKSSILSVRCHSKISLVYLTGPAAFGAEAERCVIITRRGVLREDLLNIFLLRLSKSKQPHVRCKRKRNRTFLYSHRYNLCVRNQCAALFVGLQCLHKNHFD